MTRTIEDVLKDWNIRASGRTRYEGQEPRDDELVLAEITRLRADNVTLAEAVKPFVFTRSRTSSEILYSSEPTRHTEIAATVARARG